MFIESMTTSLDEEGISLFQTYFATEDRSISCKRGQLYFEAAEQLVNLVPHKEKLSLREEERALVNLSGEYVCVLMIVDHHMRLTEDVVVVHAGVGVAHRLVDAAAHRRR